MRTSRRSRRSGARSAGVAGGGTAPLAAFVLGLVAALAGAEAACAAGYGATTWGMPREKLVAMFPDAAADAQSVVVTGRVAGFAASTGYGLLDGRLARVDILILERRETTEQRLADHDELKRLLTLKYGPPRSSDVVWKGSSPGAAGRASLIAGLESSSVILKTTWEAEGTRVMLTCLGRASGAAVLVTYEPLRPVELHDEERIKDL
jgi:hypothetical protein